MMTSVAGDPSAIGYISMGSLNESVRALQIDGVDATVENIKTEPIKLQGRSILRSKTMFPKRRKILSVS